jgi:colanic acid/amylovoran biosynthesis glycosyltransferase
VSGQRVGYIVSRFPKTTETFIVREMQAVEREGWAIVPFAIRRELDEIVQPGAESYATRLVAISDLGARRLLRAQARLARRDPRRWGAIWRRTIVGNAPSPRFLLRGLVIAFGAPAIAEEIAREGISHLHAHWATHSALLAHLVAMLTDLPYSITLHAHDLHVDRTMLATKLGDAVAVVTISEHNATFLRSEYPAVADRVHVVHCGVDTHAIPFRPPGAVRRPLRLATVAGLRPFKGHRYLLDALGELERREIAVRCDLVGDGPLRAELEQRATGNVVFHGAVDVTEAMAIVAAADVFVMPSIELADGRRDGIPVAMIEAMALGVPVIASAVSGIPELVRDGVSGLLVPPAYASAIADAIERLSGDVAARRAMATRARQTVESHFDLSQTGRSMASIFEQSIRRIAAGQSTLAESAPSPRSAARVTAGARSTP